jgi:hypothetical protein
MTERYEHILGRKGPERARPDKNLDKMSLLENRERMSVAHNITVTIEGNIVSARQINNSILLDKTQREALKKIASDLSTPQFNIPAISVEKLFEGTLANADVVTHPVSIIMISSEGLLNLSEWTSNQPSE